MTWRGNSKKQSLFTGLVVLVALVLPLSFLARHRRVLPAEAFHHRTACLSAENGPQPRSVEHHLQRLYQCLALRIYLESYRQGESEPFMLEVTEGSKSDEFFNFC